MQNIRINASKKFGFKIKLKTISGKPEAIRAPTGMPNNAWRSKSLSNNSRSPRSFFAERPRSENFIINPTSQKPTTGTRMNWEEDAAITSKNGNGRKKKTQLAWIKLDLGTDSSMTVDRRPLRIPH